MIARTFIKALVASMALVWAIIEGLELALGEPLNLVVVGLISLSIGFWCAGFFQRAEEEKERR